MENFDDRGDHNPPNKSLEIPHKNKVTSKIKRKINHKGTNEVELEDETSVECMDLDENIEGIEFLNKEPRVQERKQVAAELGTLEPLLLEEETLNFHISLLDKSKNKLVFQNFIQKTKHFKENLVQNLISMGSHLLEFYGSTKL
jgi:hypothetical protein